MSEDMQEKFEEQKWLKGEQDALEEREKELINMQKKMLDDELELKQRYGVYKHNPEYTFENTEEYSNLSLESFKINMEYQKLELDSRLRDIEYNRRSREKEMERFKKETGKK